MSEIIQDEKPIAEPSPAVGSEPVQTQPVAPSAEPEEPQKPPKGFVPYQALEEERNKRKQTEAELEALRSAPSEPEMEVFSDEGKALKSDIKTLSDKLRSIERKEALREAETEFPFLKDKKEEFQEFLEDEENKRLSIRKAAQLFGAEKGLLASEPQRKGLEKPTGGGQIPPEHTYSKEEIEDMMKNEYPKYEKLVREGKI